MVRISRAWLNECHKIRTLEREVWGEDVTSAYDAAYYVRFGYCFVARDTDSIVAALVAMRTRNNEVKIIDLVVDKDYRRRGVATRLLGKLIKDVGQLPIVGYVREDDEATFALNTKLGFKRVGKIKDPFYLNETGSFFIMKLRNTTK